MSNALAIATVTETLVEVLSGALRNDNIVSGAQVTALPPDSSSGLPETGVNVFLYQITPNAALRNADLPTRSADGTLLRCPQAALDLHYLLTFYGDETTLDQQRLLGVVASTLHAYPVLSRSTVQSTEQNIPFLNSADLDQQIDLVRVTPINFSLEELSKLWSFLLKTDYVLSIAYVAGVVLIDAQVPVPPPPLPVLTTNIYAFPFAQPVVTQIASSLGPNVPIISTDSLVVTGTNFLGTAPSMTSVLIGGIEVAPSTVSSTSLTAALPAGLAAGAQTLQIQQSMMMGTPTTPHQGLQSSLATFVLNPTIRQSSPGVYDITVMGSASPPGEIVTVTIDPAAQVGQRVLLELIDVAAPGAANLFDGGTLSADTNTLTFDVVGMLTGSNLVSVLIGGAASPFDLDPSGTPIAPLISF